MEPNKGLKVSPHLSSYTIREQPLQQHGMYQNGTILTDIETSSRRKHLWIKIAVRISQLHKAAVRVMTNVNNQNHCRALFIDFIISSLPLLFVYVAFLRVKKSANYPTHYIISCNNVMVMPQFA